MNKLIENRYDFNLPLDYYLNPDYIYIPIYIDKLPKHKYVYKNDVVYNNQEIEYYTSISGEIVGICENLKINNQDIKCLKIENDFQEKNKNNISAVKYINKYSKEEVISLIKKYMPNFLFNKNAKTILVNGIDKEDSEKTYSFIINHNSDKLLEAVDALAGILSIENVLIAVNNKDTRNIVNLTSNIGTYPNIKLKMVPDVYPIGFRNVLMKNILSKNEIENGILYLTVEDLLNIYNILKKNKPITEKYVTIGGNCVKKPLVIYTKIGVKIGDLIKNKIEIINDDYYVIINGLISGITLESLNSLVTIDTRSIFLNTLANDTEKECINCGLCTSKCPVGLNPKYIKEHKKADRKKCIKCGLCSYICPSKINFKECLNESKK